MDCVTPENIGHNHLPQPDDNMLIKEHEENVIEETAKKASTTTNSTTNKTLPETYILESCSKLMKNDELKSCEWPNTKAVKEEPIDKVEYIVRNNKNVVVAVANDNKEDEAKNDKSTFSVATVGFTTKTPNVTTSITPTKTTTAATTTTCPLTKTIFNTTNNESEVNVERGTEQKQQLKNNAVKSSNNVWQLENELYTKLEMPQQHVLQQQEQGPHEQHQLQNNSNKNNDVNAIKQKQQKQQLENNITNINVINATTTLATSTTSNTNFYIDKTAEINQEIMVTKVLPSKSQLLNYEKTTQPTTITTTTTPTTPTSSNNTTTPTILERKLTTINQGKKFDMIDGSCIESDCKDEQLV